MQHLVRTIVSALVDYPEAVEVQQVDGETTCILEVRVAPEDIGKVIGRQGRNIAALRTLLHAVGAKERKHVLLEGLDDIGLTLKHATDIAAYEQSRHPGATMYESVDAKYFPKQ